MKKLIQSASSASLYLFTATAALAQTVAPGQTVKTDLNALGFTIPTLTDVLTFLVRMFFVIAGLAALLYLLLGAFAWVTSGGAKDGVEKARDKIQAAIVGVLLIVIVLAVIATLETFVFRSKVCFGLTCPLTIPSLL